MPGRSLFTRTFVPGLDEVIPGFPEGGLVIIAGEPGTGKTIFGASFIYYGAQENNEPGIYASMFESENKFLQYMSRLGMDFRKLIDEGLVRYLSLPTLLETGIAAITNEIIEAAELIHAKRLVIDSFTALKQVFEKPVEARVFLQTIFSRTLEKMGCTTVLINEGTPFVGQQNFEEYVADVVIYLRSVSLADKPVREMTFKKLRGAELRNPTLCYTIQKGIRVLPPTKHPRLRSSVKFTPPPDPPRGYTTGIPALDREIGGYPNGSVVLLEVDREIRPRWEYHLVLAPTVVSYVLKERPCVVVPSGGNTWRDVVRDCMEYGLPKEYFAKFFRIFHERPYAKIPMELPSYVVAATTENWEETLDNYFRIVHELYREHQKPPMRVIGLDSLACIFGERSLDMVYRGRAILREFGGLLILIGKPVYPWIIERLAPIVDIHLKMTRRHGCLLIYGIKPSTPIYAIQVDPEKSPPVPDLFAIV